MVYYNEIPEINKRMVAGYYLFLCLIGFAILLGPTGSGIPITLVGTSDRDKHEALLSRLDWGLTDPSACDGAAPCHGNRYGNWSLTGHRWAAWYNASSDHIVLGPIEMGFNVFNATTGTNLFNDSHCVTCHTTGWDNSTGTPTYDYLGVNCFACHDVNADEWVDYSGDTCGAVCHTGDLFGDHPQQYPVWNRSRHANSMTDLRTSTHAASRCMHCQATEAFIHQQNPGELATTSPNVDQVNWNPYLNDIYNYTSISCPACH
ncbi:MAG: multiheme c-type cytochrome, partial [Promethearchaeota archaeon]